MPQIVGLVSILERDQTLGHGLFRFGNPMTCFIRRE